jgi:hypothetical protein
LQQRQYASLTPTCDNDGRCTTLSATAPMRATHDNLPEITAPIPAARPQLRPLDANGNGAGGLVISRKTGARAHVGVAYAARFQAYIDDIETITARACCLWAAFVPGAVYPPASIRAEKPWMYASCDVVWLSGAAICPVGSPSAALRLRTVCSKADAGAIRTMVTSSLG